MTETNLAFRDVGIATILNQINLAVPVNQRPYKWDQSYVQTLFQDLAKAFENSQQIYFLGIIALTRAPNNQYEVADGQQRLATISILIAAIRDYLLELGEGETAKSYEQDYLIKYEPRLRDNVQRLKLNSQDNEFFYKRILLQPEDRTKDPVQHSFISHDLLDGAAAEAATYVRNVTAAYGDSDKVNHLIEFIEFLKQYAVVIEVIAPTSMNAFKMFETLNARGVKASQADILKNFLFDRAKGRLADVNAGWLSMVTKIESFADNDELLLSYLRHYWIMGHGPTTEAELGDEIEAEVKNERMAVNMVVSLDAVATDYIALLNPKNNPRWQKFSPKAQDALDNVTRELGIEQILPLMLAVAAKFDDKEAEKAFKMFVSWSVRFLIAGKGGGGVLEKAYASRAKEITKGTIPDAAELLKKMEPILPTDAAFTERFQVANVSRTNFARYYLRAIELFMKQDPEPQMVPSEDIAAVNLEHILPLNPSSEWKIKQEIAETYYRRLGNMTLLRAKDNVTVANKGFEEKKKAYKISPFVLTTELTKYAAWGPEEIQKRQVEMAKLAPKVWPLKWK